MDTITPPTTKGRTLSSTSTDLAAPNPPRRPPDLLETGRDPEPGATRLRRVEAPPLLRAAPWSPSRRLARGSGHSVPPGRVAEHRKNPGNRTGYPVWADWKGGMRCKMSIGQANLNTSSHEDRVRSMEVRKSGVPPSHPLTGCRTKHWNAFIFSMFFSDFCCVIRDPYLRL